MPAENDQTQKILDKIHTGLSQQADRSRRVIPPEIEPQPTWGKSPFYHPREFKKGGLVRKTGLVKVHKGELILTKKQAAALKTATKALSLRSKLRKKKPVRKQTARIAKR